jgi:hypothetical protein
MIQPQALKKLGFAPYNIRKNDFYTTFRKSIGALNVEVTTDLESGTQTVEIGLGDSWHRCNNIDTATQLVTLLEILK